jgi:hypothetical protein
MTMPRLILLGAVMCLAAVGAHAQQVTLTDDASTWAGKPPAPPRRGVLLQVAGASDRTFLKFDVRSQLPDGTLGGHIGQATLVLFVASVSEAGQVAVHRVAGAWEEETITHAAAPAPGAVDAIFAIDAGFVGKWVGVDVTPLVRDWIDGAVPNDGLALLGVGATQAEFNSKENADTSHEPRLTLVLTHAATAGHASTAGNAVRLGGAAPGDFVRTDDPRLAGGGGPPSPGSPHYIHNSGGQQAGANFNIGGTGTAAALSAGTVNAQSAFTFRGARVLGIAGIGHPFGESLYIGRNAGVNAAPDVGLNTFVGSNAGALTTTGAQNAFFGSNAGYLNTSGGQNAYFGDGAGVFSNGSQNSFFGFVAGFQNTTGSLNAFFGNNAGEKNTTGCCNSFFGNFAGWSNTTGFANVFVGGSAGGRHVDGFRNTLIGDLAGNDLFEGTALLTGNRNTFVGSVSGRRIATGSSNTFVGVDTTGTPDIQFASAFGSNATVTANDTIVIGKAAGEYYGVARPADTVIIPGSLNVAGTLSLNIVNAATQFNMGGERVLVFDPLFNLSVGRFAGMANGGRNNTNVGSQAGQNSTGIANVFIGNRSGRSTAGNSNTFVGSIAGEFHTTGDENTFVGDGAGADHTGGSHNSYFGVDAGRGGAGTNSSRNSFFGTLAGRHILTGVENAAFGYRAGFANAAGGGNTVVGAYAGENNTASNNAFFGAQAGRLNIAGGSNAFFGAFAGRDNVTGGLNSFFGSFAGANTLESHNSFFGTNAGTSNELGAFNSFFGRSAGFRSLASFNAFFGAGAGALTTTGADNSFFGTGAGSDNVTGAHNTFVGRTAGSGNANGSHNTLLGSGTNVAADNLTHATALGAGAVVDRSDTVVLGRANDTVRIPGSLAIAGLFSAAAFAGNGSGLTDLDAGNITTGTLANARLGLIPTANIADGAVTAAKIAPGQVVKSVNGLTDDLVLMGGPNISITAAGNTLTFATAGSPNTILNQTVLQAGANFNIDGTGAAGVFDATTHYSINGARVFAARDGNVFAGQGTGTSSIGTANSFFGFQSGQENAMGVSNAFFGFQAGQFNRDGSLNAFFGMRAGFRNIASGNAFFGTDAGRENTTGQRNSYFGTAAGKGIVEGADNSIFGYDAGASFSLDASRNSFFGAAAGLSSRGSDNVFVGAGAGRASFDGSGHTFVGAGAGRIIQSGFANTLLGFNAQAAEGVANATAIGANATVSQNDAVVLGAWNARVGIGTDVPREKLEVLGGNILVASPGAGILLRSPDGNTCGVLTLSDAGALALTAVPCP